MCKHATHGKVVVTLRAVQMELGPETWNAPSNQSPFPARFPREVLAWRRQREAPKQNVTIEIWTPTPLTTRVKYNQPQ
jgi:hypothetical protein